jgi:hypothetical protein
MITNPSGDPSTWPATVERRQDGDGTAGFWDQTFDKLLNRGAYDHDQILGPTNGFFAKLASQAVGAFGTFLVGQRAVVDANQGTLAAGTLLSAIQAIWAGKAGLAANNIFTGPRSRSGTAATDAERVTHLASTVTAFSFATAHDTIWVNMLDGASPHGVPQTWTASDTSVLNSTVNLAAYGTLIDSGVTVVREDTSVICTLGGAGTGFATIKFLADAANPAGRWRLTSGSGAVSVTTPF